MPRVDNRRLEVVADGLPLSMALSWPSTPLWSVLSEQMVLHEGSVLDVTELRRGEPKNSGIQNSLATRVGPVWFLLACETGGRWSEEAHDFLRQRARARARWEPPEIRQAARRAWFRRWCTALACCAAQTFALPLLERRGCCGVDGEVPSTCDVIWDDRREG